MDKKKSKFRLALIVVGIVLCVMFSCVLQAPESLNEAAAKAGSTGTFAMRILGITLLSIFWWIADVFPDWLTTIFMMLMWILIGGVPFKVAFGAFAGTSVWLIVGAFSLAAAVNKSGFFTRISWFLLRLFSPTFNGQILAMLVVGAVCAPLIPTFTAKGLLGVTIAYGVANAMGYDNNSRGRAGIITAAWFGFASTAPAFTSGSIFGYTLLGALPPGQSVTWSGWAIACLPWLAILLVGGFFALRMLYKPERDSAMSREYAAEKYRELGPLKGRELAVAIIFISSILLWVFEAQTGIDPTVTAMGAAFLCFALGFLDTAEINRAPSWPLVIFLGGVLSLGAIFGRVGINAWLQSVLAPVFEPLGSPVTAAAVIAASVWLVRFVIVSQSATIILMMAILSPLSETIGLSPFIIGLVTYMSEGIWFMPYQNVTFVTAFSGAQGSLEYKSTLRGCAAYMIISLIGVLASVPYWRMLGYIK